MVISAKWKGMCLAKLSFTHVSESHPPAFCRTYPLSLYIAYILPTVLQGDEKVSVHLLITIQKDTDNVQSVPRQSTDIYLLTRRTVFSKTVFSIARYTF